MDKKIPQLAIILPCYNEEEILTSSIEKLSEKIQKLITNHVIADNSYMLFVDDGSTDRTWQIVEQSSVRNTKIHGVKLATNVGHQNALLAGLNYTSDKCDIAITIDADLQHNIDSLIDMIDKYKQGFEVVLGVRKNRGQNNIIKAYTGALYYKFLQLINVPITPNHADFRLMSAKAISNLLYYGENNLFLRALPNYLHKDIAITQYEELPRTHGESKYNVQKMLALAWNGITSFSIFPLRLITFLGIFILFITMIYSIYVIISYFQGDVLSGWTSVVLPIYSLGGLILFSIGLVGEYIGKIFLEVKNRPRYLIDKITHGADKNE